MTDQNQPGSANQSHTKNRPKANLALVGEHTNAQVELAQLPPERLGAEAADGRDDLAALLRGPDGAFGAGTVENQAARLGDPRLTTIQRQALAVQIGQVQGNRHIQRVVGSLERSKNITPVTHSRDQAVERQEMVVQRTPPEPGPAMITTPPAAGTTGVTKIFIFQIPNDPYIEDMRLYIQNTLGVPAANIIAIERFQQIFQRLEALREARVRVSRLIIVSHGSRGELVEERGGQVREAAGWATPDEVMAFARTDPVAQRVREHVMAPGAVVEFWGCSIGAHYGAQAAWTTATGTQFRAPTQRMEIAPYVFPERRARRGERGPRVYQIRNRRWVIYTHTDQIPPRRQARFRQWLIEKYRDLAANREIRETTPARNDDAKVAYMQNLFNRSGGIVRFMQITVRETGAQVRPGQPAWLGLWETAEFNPIRLMD